MFLKKLRAWCFLFIFINTISLKAQINIIPLINCYPWYLCAYSNPNEGHLYFKKNIRGNYSGDWGVFLKLVPISSKINLYSGIYNGNLSYGYRFQLPGGNTFYSGSRAYIYEFPVFVNLLDYKIRFKKQIEEEDIPPPKRSLYVKTYFGFAFDYEPYNRYNWNGGSLSIGGPSTGEYVNQITDNGVSAMAAISLYLYNNVTQNESWSLSVFYWQGFTNILSIDVLYTINNTNYDTRLFSRATSVDLVLAYSIPLNYKKWFANKTQKQDGQQP